MVDGKFAQSNVPFHVGACGERRSVRTSKSDHHGLTSRPDHRRETGHNMYRHVALDSWVYDSQEDTYPMSLKYTHENMSVTCGIIDGARLLSQ